MTDTPWRDAYDDPEGMAKVLDQIADELDLCAGSEAVKAAAACIREQAGRIAELEAQPTPAPELEDEPLLHAALLPIRQAHTALTGEWEPEPGILYRAKVATDYLRGSLIAAGFEARDFAAPVEPTPEQEGLRARLMDAMEAHSVLIEKHDGEGERAVYMGDLESIVSDALTPERPGHPDEWVIWSGEHGAFWRAEGKGYTDDHTQAGVFTRADAESRTSHCGPEKRIEIREARFERPDQEGGE